ncbi:MAG: ABC transporter permease [Inconstantimicrobium porci]|uniref:ABC transporter permease n=1 Tax=Inconstantimicrobium porci TaxID=2652291 RepID=A0A7X2T1M3_9CLOT|nr:ABC transporter permease [Inconstantimicrobium porci]MDD6770722.1 ABC transporter permease [Inconstantimicrobium porci]MDY5913468.1 ABC transporter permease [Inconstantimicrobium porci]MSR91724.1 ABC transporter permease [Inconstantimicrobium porci]
MKKLAKILKKPFTATVIAILCGFMVASIVLALTGYSPIACFSALFKGVFSKPKYISNTIIKATPLILTAVSVAFAFKTGLFNIGAEGQYIVGTIASVIVGIKLNLPPVLQIPVVILAGVIAGALWGAIVGLLKAKFGIHEVITSIMLNWIALYLCNFVVNMKAFHQPDSTSTVAINPSGFTTILGEWKKTAEGQQALSSQPWLYEMFVKTDVNIGIIIAIIVAILIWVLLYKSSKGYELRAVGFNKDAAEFAGINVNKNIILSMVIAGAISGLAGALIITGIEPHKISTLAAFENAGFNGMSVALIAGSSPIGCIFAGLLFGGLLYGGQSVQFTVGAPSEIINIMIGTIVFFVALTAIVPKLADKLEKRGEQNAK